jgi:hypothetical protein
VFDSDVDIEIINSKNVEKRNKYVKNLFKK